MTASHAHPRPLAPSERAALHERYTADVPNSWTKTKAWANALRSLGGYARRDVPRLLDALKAVEAERDAAITALNEHCCNEQAESAYRRAIAAENERDEARAELAERDEWMHATAALLPEGVDGEEWEGEVIARYIRESQRPAPAWDEDAVRSEFKYRLRTAAAYFRMRGKHGEQPDPDWIERECNAAMLAVRKHLPILPDRETVIAVLSGLTREQWDRDGDDLMREAFRGRFGAQADTLLALFPGRSEAEVKVEGWNAGWEEAVDYVRRLERVVADHAKPGDRFLAGVAHVGRVLDRLKRGADRG